MVGIFCLSIYLQSRNDMYEAFFRSFDHVKIPVVLSITCNLSITLVTLLCIYYLPYPVFWAAAGIFVSWFLQGTILRFLAEKEYAPSHAVQTPKLSSRDLLQAVSPISIGAIAFIIYARIDVLMLQWMGFEDTIAIYGCAFRPIGFFSIFVAAFYHAFAPTVSRMIHQDSQKALWISLQIGALFSFIGLILGGVIFSFSESLISLLYPLEFQDAASGLKALAWSLPIVFGGNAIGFYLVSFGHRGAMRYMWVNIIGVLVNILGNYWVIPHFNFVGAAWITVCTDGLTTLLMLFFALKIQSNISETTK
ncbi:hypothetical protein GF373_02660 [bacterium]|nr:hypothetical protein [bacterium]